MAIEGEEVDPEEGEIDELLGESEAPPPMKSKDEGPKSGELSPAAGAELKRIILK